MENFLPHTRNAQAGNNAWEAVVPSQFAVYLMPPAAVGDATILTEHVISISGLFIEYQGNVITQQFQMATRSYDSNDKQTFYDITINFSLNLNDANDNYVYNILQRWSRLKWDPTTGKRGLKKDYIGQLTGVKYNRDGSIYQQRTAFQCFPSSDLPDLNGDYTAHDPQQCEMTFRADWVEDA